MALVIARYLSILIAVIMSILAVQARTSRETQASHTFTCNGKSPPITCNSTKKTVESYFKMYNVCNCTQLDKKRVEKIA